MASSARSRSTRGRPAKPPLSEDAVIDAGLAILRAEGLEAVTMRRVAAELDTGPASIYVYVSGRDELRRLMLDRITATAPLQTPDPARWREQVHEVLSAWLEAMEAHPGIASVAVGDPPTGENTLRGADNLLALLLAGSIRAQDAAWACDILPLITTATAVETDVHRARGGSEAETVERLDAAFTALPADRFPHLSRYSSELLSGTGDERFRFAIDVVLDGLVARAARS